MWIYRYLDKDEVPHFKCFVCAHDVERNLVNEVPFCPGLLHLAAIDVTVREKEGSEEKDIVFTQTRNISDFPQKESFLRTLLFLTAQHDTTDYIPVHWTLVPGKEENESRFPGVASITYGIIETTLDGKFDVEGYKGNHRLLMEQHTMVDGKQFCLPRFAIIDLDPTQIVISEIVYQYHEDEEKGMILVNCEITEPRSQKKVNVTLDFPMMAPVPA